MRQSPAALRFLKKVGSAASGRPDFQSVAAPLEHDRKQYVIAEAKRSRAIVVSYSCDIDKVLTNIADGHAATPSEVCFLAPVSPMDNYRRIADDLRNDAVENAYAIAQDLSVGRPELVIDFTYTQPISMREVLQVLPRREWALTPEGQRILSDRFARFFGSAARVAAAAAGLTDPTLLARARTALGIIAP